MQNVENAYELRLYDKTLLEFTFEEQGVSLAAHVIYVDEKNARLLPMDLQRTDEGIIKWLRHRVIPKNRTFVEEILKSLGLSVGNTKGIIDVCMGLSLNDCFWVVQKGFEGTFAEYNFYENDFFENLSSIAFTGIEKNNQSFNISPELTTNGMLPKAWRRMKNGEIYLYKGGSSGAANTGNEPYSEFYACQIAKTMGLHAVTYDLENWKGILASKCQLFTDMDTAFVPIGRLVRSGGLQACLDYLAELGEDFAEAAHSMLVFDEELNIQIMVDDLYMDVIHTYPDITVHLYLYNARIEASSPPIQKLEHVDIRWIYPSEISKYNFCPADKDILERLMD